MPKAVVYNSITLIFRGVPRDGWGLRYLTGAKQDRGYGTQVLRIALRRRLPGSAGTLERA